MESSSDHASSEESDADEEIYQRARNIPLPGESDTEETDQGSESTEDLQVEEPPRRRRGGVGAIRIRDKEMDPQEVRTNFLLTINTNKSYPDMLEHEGRIHELDWFLRNVAFEPQNSTRMINEGFFKPYQPKKASMKRLATEWTEEEPPLFYLSPPYPWPDALMEHFDLDVDFAAEIGSIQNRLHFHCFLTVRSKTFLHVDTQKALAYFKKLDAEHYDGEKFRFRYVNVKYIPPTRDAVTNYIRKNQVQNWAKPSNVSEETLEAMMTNLNL